MQWIALGVDATGEREMAVVDPEALVALTAELGDADPRLRDASTDWCVRYGRYVNGSRLKQVAHEIDTPPAAIGEYVATVAAAGGPRWPMATRPRDGYASRGKARLDVARSRPQIRIRLRAAFGVNARADVLAALLDMPSGLSVADLARAARFSKPNVQLAVDALVLAGVIDARNVGNERRVSLPTSTPVLPGLRAPVPQPDWVLRFGIGLDVLRFEEQDEQPPSVRAIEARRLAERLSPSLKREGLRLPNFDAVGLEFGAAFDRWRVDLVDWLRKPIPA